MLQAAPKTAVQEEPNPFFVHKESKASVDHLHHQFFTTVAAINTLKNSRHLHMEAIDACSTIINAAKNSLQTI